MGRMLMFPPPLIFLESSLKSSSICAETHCDVGAFGWLTHYTVILPTCVKMVVLSIKKKNRLKKIYFCPLLEAIILKWVRACTNERKDAKFPDTLHKLDFNF